MSEIIQGNELTLEVDVISTEFQLHALKSFRQGLMVVPDALLGSSAEGKGKVGISLLAILVGTNCVHPQDHFLVVFILE